MEKNHLALGKLGEEMAASLLITKGFILLERNWRYKRLEIDIIAAKEQQLYFVEVKTRATLEFGYPEENILKKKMKRIRIAATHYHFLHPMYKRIQFDVLAVCFSGETCTEIKHFEDVYG
ncbi:YraN family protein [Sediminibacterium salmoneum]|uniref:YraN family protein n=1 Tax=Sediminibacterium salmoneum TaxID=426421 RepID=UPI00047EDC0F|nr:YraN family protein [Sediminibacterium salmoneum]